MIRLSIRSNPYIVVSQYTSEKKDLLVSMYGMVFQAYIDKVCELSRYVCGHAIYM